MTIRTLPGEEHLAYAPERFATQEPPTNAAEWDDPDSTDED